MNIRPATSSDIPAIIQLLKKSLGESLMPKSEAYWRWKHVDNPFGESPVLLAEEDGHIIGVRAFMQWEWKSVKQSYQAIRAVDTATDPAHQGKGIFKKLTLGLLESCEKKGIDLVFNTPNNQSKPGYLKMGWLEAGKLPVQLSLKKPLHMLKAKLEKRPTAFLKLKEAANFSLAAALQSFNFQFTEQVSWHTHHSIDYLKWRYLEIPIIPYYAHKSKKACIIFRLKDGSLGQELRICDTFGEVKEVKILIKDIYQKCTFDYMSIEGFTDLKLPGFLKLIKSIGPDVTIRPLAQKELSDFEEFSNWEPSLGDLEVF